MVQRALFGASLILLLTAFAQAPWHLLVLRFLQGSLSGTVTATNALVASITPREHLGRTLGYQQMANFVGSTVGPLIGGVTADLLGYRVSFVFTGFLCLLAGLAVVRWVYEPRAETTRKGPIQMPSLRQLRHDPALQTVLHLAPVIFMVQFATMALGPIFALYVAQLERTPFVATLAGVLVATTGLVAAASSMLAGRLIARYGVRRVMVVSVFGSACAHLAQALVNSVPQLWGARILLGMSSGAWAPASNSTVGLSVPPDQRGIAFGIAASASAFGNSFGPLTGGYLAATLGIRAVFFTTAAMLLLAGLWLIVRLGNLGDFK